MNPNTPFPAHAGVAYREDERLQTIHHATDQAARRRLDQAPEAFQINMNPVSPSQLAVLRAAVQGYRDLINSPESADRDANGNAWADQEVQACDVLLKGLLAPAAQPIEMTQDAFLELQKEAEYLELADAMGQDMPGHPNRLKEIDALMKASPWTVHPDHRCVRKDQVAALDQDESLHAPAP